MKRIAFHAPLKPVDHPVPSGDRRMARLFVRALEMAGYGVEIASDLRTRDGRGDDAVQRDLAARGEAEVVRLAATWAGDPPDLWFTYHCYYKAPDLLGPALSARFGIPYVIAEASRARKRLTGPWAGWAARAEAAIDAADLLLAMTAHDREALDRDAPAGQRIADLPPFLDPEPDPAPKTPSETRQLLAVAMMREGDKLASYRALAEALTHLDGDWTLRIVGEGPCRDAVEAAFARFGDRVTFRGALDADALAGEYAAADVMVWPGVGEAYGMVYLEAQAADTPVVAEDRPGPRAVIGGGSRLVPVGDGRAFARVVKAVLHDPASRRQAREYVVARHGIGAAAARLGELLGELT